MHLQSRFRLWESMELWRGLYLLHSSPTLNRTNDIIVKDQLTLYWSNQINSKDNQSNATIGHQKPVLLYSISAFTQIVKAAKLVFLELSNLLYLLSLVKVTMQLRVQCRGELHKVQCWSVISLIDLQIY